MEQHVENILKQHRDRVNRRIQLEKEMSKVSVSNSRHRELCVLHQFASPTTVDDFYSLLYLQSGEYVADKSTSQELHLT